MHNPISEEAREAAGKLGICQCAKCVEQRAEIVQRVIDAERERCAKLADEQAAPFWFIAGSTIAKRIAAAIRNGDSDVR